MPGLWATWLTWEERSMAYVIEEITPEHLQKIINDAGPETERGKWLARAQDAGFLTIGKRYWAVNRECNHYLLTAPSQAPREESGLRPYYFFAYGKMYKIRRNGHGGSEFFFDEKDLPTEDELLRVQQEIGLAFDCYGSSGRPKRDEISNIRFIKHDLFLPI
jgi:hypothetical protein